jgi:xylan 1,4-beta-xylosidase
MTIRKDGMGIKNVVRKAVFVFAIIFVFTAESQPRVADNGNGTFTNPLFYEEFSDPDMIRVGDDYYLTGTTMHSMPGLPVLHSKDMVNWEFLSYALDRLDLGPAYRLEGGKDIYGQGIWAPCFRFHNGTYYIFSNVNGKTTQKFTAKNPAGPWTRTAMKRSFHDLSVLFDDDPPEGGKGKVYVVWGYQAINFAELNDELTDIVPGTQRVIIKKDAGMGEGLHFYKITRLGEGTKQTAEDANAPSRSREGKYYITSACWDGRMRMACARGDKPEGPYEVNPAISIDEDFGLAEGYRLTGQGRESGPFKVIKPNTRDGGRLSMHQGGIIETKSGQWWGFSMMDYNAQGRLTCLSPITWVDGWPYFGLAGNLKRTPRTWVKPDTGTVSQPREPYERNDDFSETKLKPIWQWNHIPDDSKWSLTERPGFLRLHSLPAAELMSARNTLTQRSIGPVSIPTVVMDTNGMQAGDVAGLALFNFPYAWIGVSRGAEDSNIVQFNQLTGKTESVPFKGTRVWLRANCDFLKEKAQFSYSTDGEKFEPMGDEFTMIFQLKTFQGIRYSLFNFNIDKNRDRHVASLDKSGSAAEPVPVSGGSAGGYVDFDKFTVDEVYPQGFMRAIPFGQVIKITTYGGNCVLGVKDGNLAAISAKDSSVKDKDCQFKVIDRGLGRVALQYGDGYVCVKAPGNKGQVTLKTGEPNNAETFQWTENVYGDIMLMSLVTDRYIRIDPQDCAISADWPGPKPDRKDGSCLSWEAVTSADTNSDSVAEAGNPIIKDVFTADPAPMVYNDTVYLYVGHDEAKGKEMFTMWEWLCFSSKDMKTWTAHGLIMKVKDFKWAARDAWAAQVVERNGKFYLYATAQHDKTHPGKAIGVAVSDSPTGPFVDARGSALVTDNMTRSPNGWDDIDPTVLIDDDGTAWLAWGNPNCYLAKLKPNMIELDGTIQKIHVPNYTEGPWLHKRGNMYYLTYAAFAHQGLSEKVCYATAAKITGPWTYRGILTDQAKNSYTIHPGIIEYHGQWYFFYHNATLTLNGEKGALGRRCVCVEYMYYNPDGTIQPIKQTVEGVTVPPKVNPATEATSQEKPTEAANVTSAGVSVTQDTGYDPENWPDNPILSTTTNPYYTATEGASFSQAAGGASIGQTFTIAEDFKLQRIDIFAGDGFGTAGTNTITLALYDLTSQDTNSYSGETNLFGSGKGLQIAYKPQAPGLLLFDFSGPKQVILKAGHIYAFELQGTGKSATLFWRRTKKDTYPGGAAYRNRSVIKEKTSNFDFAMSVYGTGVSKE